MFEIEIINAALFQNSVYKDATKAAYGIDTYIILKFHGKEIGHSSIVTNTYEPIWNEKFRKSYEELFAMKERSHQRPCYLEMIDVEVYEVSPTNIDKSTKIYETKVPLRNAFFKSYRLMPPASGSSSNSSNNSTNDEAAISNTGSTASMGSGNSHPASGGHGGSSSGGNGEIEHCRVFIRISRQYHNLFSHITSLQPMELRQILPPTSKRYRHLYLDFQHNTSGFTYRTGLPGPTVGELLMDRYEYCELKLPVIANSFGDRISASCYGSIYITDLRIIFLPTLIAFPLQNEFITLPGDCIKEGEQIDSTAAVMNLDEKQMLYLHRYTIQIPLSSLHECKYFPVTNSNIANPVYSPDNGSNRNSMELLESTKYSLACELLDNSIVEFFIARRPMPRHTFSQRITRPVEADVTHPNYYLYMSERLHNPWYCAGLDTAEVEPIAWCSRVIDYLSYEIRLDVIYVRWAKYMKATIKQFLQQATNNEKQWMKKVKAGSINLLDVDYQRYNIQDLDWQFSDLNANYNLCPTYPSILVFPGLLSDEDLVAAASQRSIGRLPALVWLHGNTKAALCRASQPMAGISGNMIEFDRKLCLSIKTSAPMQLPLRIADARPKLNANANAVQGKGFENITYLGGPSQASLVFLDIENIHVVRSSFHKVKEGVMMCSLYNSNVDSNTIATTTSTNGTGSVGSGSSNSTSSNLLNNTVNSMGMSVSGNSQSYDSLSNSSYSQITASKWINHIASILRGAAGIADSLMIGHPVLVHCSDGWDRTAQLTTLAQLLLDPFYRTAEGYLILIYKEWCSFGHKFEDRTGRSGRNKEISPIFLQMIDCTYQLMNQYPQYFEFTTTYLLYIIQCFYSGYFVTFRGNNERDRLLMSRRTAIYEEMVQDDLEFSNMSLYMNLLLRGSTTSMLMMNPNYIPPKTNEKQVQYIRPRYNPSDIDLWREGIFGMNYNILELSGQGMPRVTSSEGNAITTNFVARMMSYLDVHWNELATVTRDKLEIIKAAPYACPAFPANYYNSGSSILNTIYESYSKTIMTSLTNGAGNNASYFTLSGLITPTSNSHAQTVRVNRAIVRIQLWYRAYCITKNVMLSEGRVNAEYYSVNAYHTGYYRNISKTEYRHNRAYHRLYTILTISYLKKKYIIKYELRHNHELLCKQYVDDIVNDIVDRGFRVELALRNVLIQQQQQQLMLLPRLVDSQGNPIASMDNVMSKDNKHKSLSARFLKAASGASNLAFFKINSTEDEGMESSDFDNDSNSSKQRNSSSTSSSSSTYSSFMKSFTGRR